MNPKILKFRNSCAEEGVELTPDEVVNLFTGYKKLKKIVKRAVKECPDFYFKLCTMSNEDKARDLQELCRQGVNMSPQDFEDFTKALKRVCEIEGYA